MSMSLVSDLEAADCLGFLLLAGGQSRRMGGGDKNLMLLDGKPLLQHVLNRIDIGNAPILLNANGDPARYASFDLPVRGDVVTGFAGPLAGILTGLEWAASTHPNVTHIISLATDAPFLPRDLPARLVAGLVDAGAYIAQASSQDRRHPVFAIWPVALAADLRHALVDQDVRKIDDFTKRYHCAVVPFEGTPDPFMNLNRPEDFAIAQAHI
ncbi:MAG: molybdenum cofactor guanylyltransferase MobA [Candidatus Puniceispirillum sp.]|jgi:molybdenum cofactor guanylyltransferase|nr:molybdenum cofactor guanylyltransferase MobA [Candidatus Puniceispirillum sp.]MBT6566526.1 molybdenum cofactor guanylyltransferase MobA [Candidatus Puniceispirillum sp.]